MPRVLVVWGEAGRVRGLCDFAVGDLLEGVDAFAGGGEGVHEMHGWFWEGVVVWWFGGLAGWRDLGGFGRAGLWWVVGDERV